MPEKTDAEWRTLVDRIAREVMGWTKWDDLSENAHRIHWSMIEEDPDEWNLAFNRDQWWFLDESGCPDYEYSIKEWEPHKSMSQMIEARDRIASRGFDWCISRWAGAPQIQALFMHGWKHYEGYADTDAKAICLAIEKFMEAIC